MTDREIMEILKQIIEILFPIFSIVALGVFFGRRFNPNMGDMNSLNMDIFIPALVFSVLIGQSVDIRDYLPLIFAALLVVLGSGLLALPLALALKIKPKTFLPPMMFNNAGNMGLPLMVLTFGESALPIAMILFLVENSTHFTLGMAWLKKSHPSSKGTSLFRSMISPLTVTTTVAIIIGMTGLTLPKTLLEPIDMLGHVAIPLMLFSLGIRLSSASLKTIPTGLLGGLACPITGLIMVIIVNQFIALSNIEKGALFLFGVLPPAILNYMFADRFNQEPAMVASIVISGNALTLITLPLMLSYVLPRYL